MAKRECPKGPAKAGSRLQTQRYVNEAPERINEAILASLVDGPPGGGKIWWTSPLVSEDFAEYRDEQFLDALDLGHLTKELVGGFWPRQGPCWDGLAVVTSPDDPEYHGVLLVDAKSHVDEVFGDGCDALSPSRETIRLALKRTADWLGVPGGPHWEERLYQSANRMAHLYFLRKVMRVPAWLVDVYFIDDPYRPTSREAWDAFRPSLWGELGVRPAEVPGLCELFLPAIGVGVD